MEHVVSHLRVSAAVALVVSPCRDPTSSSQHPDSLLPTVCNPPHPWPVYCEDVKLAAEEKKRAWHTI